MLLNGRRLAPHPISQAEGGVPSLAVNINQLPTAAIKRLEVLRDGASAIYGADATFLLFDNLNVNTYWARTRTLEYLSGV